MFGSRSKKNRQKTAPACPELSLCLAKTWKQPNGTILAGRDVFSHCLIVGEVAQNLIQRMPSWLQSAYFPTGSALIAACHDNGKVSPTFQRKLYEHLTQPSSEVWSIVKDVLYDESQWGGHAGVSQVTLEALGVGKYIPEIAGQHHGWSPNIGLRPANSEMFGGETWLAQREKLIDQLKQALEQDFPTIEEALQAKLIAGLTTVSDWIGSGYLFDNPSESSEPIKVQQAVEQAGFISPKIKPGLSFEQIFGFPPREAQVQFYELSHQPGIYILEAPMGLGKTEAALYAAYNLLAKGQATGLYFALPTQLTSEKIHDRVHQFLTKILEPDSLHQTPMLLHSLAWLKQEMGEDAAPGGEWFSQGKRGILAPFAVGTIDQALMAVLHVKHGFVRTFGLAGKVVILDEVHTYDAYTGTVIDELVEVLQKLHCTVIILSATLTHERRQALLKRPISKKAYPLISGLAQQTLTERAVKPSKQKNITIRVESEETSAIEEALTRAEQGQQVLWIENTVAEAQERFLMLSARSVSMGVDTGLLHSRFTLVDRQQNEEKWVTLLGKDGWADRGNQGRILVGTQVLEQSLDIDADFLITRLAPTDMVLQRLGRLWRHSIPHRASKAKPEAWLLAPNLPSVIENPQKSLGPSAKVYASYVLCRTLEVWQNLKHIHLPNDLRSLIEETYCHRSEQGKLAAYLHEIEEQKKKLRTLAQQGMSAIGKPKPDETVSTRYSEQTTVQVILLKRVEDNQVYQNQKGTWLTFTTGQRVFYPHNGRVWGTKRWRELAGQLQKHLVNVTEYTAPNPVSKKTVSWLKDYIYLGPPESDQAAIRIALVREDDQLCALDGATQINDYYELKYNDWLGYQANKKLE